MTKEQYMSAVEATKEYIQAGDIFQLVLSQRFRRRTFADPFEVYRSASPIISHPSPLLPASDAAGPLLSYTITTHCSLLRMCHRFLGFISNHCFDLQAQNAAPFF